MSSIFLIMTGGPISFYFIILSIHSYYTHVSRCYNSREIFQVNPLVFCSSSYIFYNYFSGSTSCWFGKKLEPSWRQKIIKRLWHQTLEEKYKKMTAEIKKKAFILHNIICLAEYRLVSMGVCNQRY